MAWGFSAILAALLLLLPGQSALCQAGVRVVISCGTLGKELEVCREGAEAWARETGNEVEVLASPSSAGERLAQMQLLLAAKGSDIDVFLIDTTWPGMLGEFFNDLRSNRELREREDEFFPAFIRNNTVKGRWIAAPWFIDAGVLYYRKDLLEKYGEKPPKTWTELTRIARRIQEAERKAGRSRMWGYVFQARAYEGLTCNALEWIHSFGGGSVVEASGQVSVRNPRALQALALAASWIAPREGAISPRGVLNSMEEEARGVFQSGDAVFLRNWPYVWKLANASDSPVQGKIGMAPLPSGEGEGASPASTLGGWSLAVSRHSRHSVEAASLVAFLTSAAEQKRRTRLLGQNPTLRFLYREPELLSDNPELPVLLRIFQGAVPRPSGVTGSRYNRVSSEAWESVHRVLSGAETPKPALQKLEKRLELIGRGGKW